MDNFFENGHYRLGVGTLHKQVEQFVQKLIPHRRHEHVLFQHDLEQRSIVHKQTLMSNRGFKELHEEVKQTLFPADLLQTLDHQLSVHFAVQQRFHIDRLDYIVTLSFFCQTSWFTNKRTCLT
jgi:hypothetical protein